MSFLIDVAILVLIILLVSWHVYLMTAAKAPDLGRKIMIVVLSAGGTLLCIVLIIIRLIILMELRMLMGALAIAGGLPVLDRLLGMSNWNGQPLLLPPSVKGHTTFECEGVAPVDKSNPIFSGLVTDFDEDCSKNTDRYPFQLEVISVYSITNEKSQQAHDTAVMQLQTKSPVMKRLYHGTSMASAKTIISEGFKLPSSQGMFGKGVYFAGTPLKSWQYSKNKGSRFLLVCDVALGNAKPVRCASPKLEPEFHLKRSWIMQLFGMPDYDSIEAISKEGGGAVNVPEYVIFNPAQALPRFVVEVQERRV